MRVPLLLVLCATLALSACGGGKAGSTTNPSAKVIDPSGNWAMVASDGAHTMNMSALFHQTGQDVTANSFIAFDDPLPFDCAGFQGVLSNGLVQNTNQFSGTVTATYTVNFPTNTTPTSSAFTFTSTLNDAGTAFTGTYTGLPGCTGLASTGTFSGAEIPALDGGWTGTIQQCTLDQSNGTCLPFGATAPFAATLAQDDATGAVTGTYQSSGDGLTGGTVIVRKPFDVLSGHFWQFTLKDNNGISYAVAGRVTDRSFAGAGAPVVNDTGHFQIVMSH